MVVALVESISVPFRTQATFLLLSVRTNIIIMPPKFLYKEHLVIIFVYQKGDIVKQPMKKASLCPKMYQVWVGWGGLGWGGVGWVM